MAVAPDQFETSADQSTPNQSIKDTYDHEERNVPILKGRLQLWLWLLINLITSGDQSTLTQSIEDAHEQEERTSSG